MFKEKTVIILGAGASWHYDYPTGDALIRRIKDTAKEISEIYNPRYGSALAYPDVDFLKENPRKLVELTSTLAERLDSFDPIMIDSFLNDNDTLRDIGKTLIAYEIMKSENVNFKNVNNRKDELTKINNEGRGSKIYKYEECFKDNWYRFLVDALISGCKTAEDLKKNNEKLDIITFNYDVSLEHYLYTRLNSMDRFEGTKTVSEFLTDDLITHVYGKVRKNPYEDVEYGTQFNKAEKNDDLFKYRLQLAYNSSLGIEVIDKEKLDNMSNHPHIIKAKTKIEEAKRIYILGFGFYQDNIDILNLNQSFSSGIVGDMQKVYYTNYQDMMKTETKLDSLCLEELSKIPNLATTSGRKIYDLGITNSNNNRIKSIRNVYDALDYDFDFI